MLGSLRGTVAWALELEFQGRTTLPLSPTNCATHSKRQTLRDSVSTAVKQSQ